MTPLLRTGAAGLATLGLLLDDEHDLEHGDQHDQYDDDDQGGARKSDDAAYHASVHGSFLSEKGADGAVAGVPD